MPFVTEELWQNLKSRLPSDWQAGESIMVAAYPKAEPAAIEPQEERTMESIIEIIHSIRNARAQYNVESNKWIEAQIYAGKYASAIVSYSQTIQTLARVKPVTFLDSEQESPPEKNALVLVLKETKVVIPMESVVNLEAEKKRLQKEIEQRQTEVTRLEARLKDKAFLTKAPTAVVDKERHKLIESKARLERLKEQLVKLQV
jgi:valyl-tRNA synthetase